LALVIALVEEKLLGIGVSGTVSNVLGGADIGVAAILLGAGDNLAQLGLPFLQLLSELFQLLFVHIYDPRSFSPPQLLSSGWKRESSIILVRRKQRQFGGQHCI